MSFEHWVGIISAATNISVVIVGIKLVRHIARVELKVELMWISFSKSFGIKDIESQD